MKNYIKGLITGMTVSFCVVVFTGAGEKSSTNELLEKSGQMGVPVIVVDDKVIIGFNKERLKKVLGL